MNLAGRMADFVPVSGGHTEVPEGLWDQLTTGPVSRGLTWDNPAVLPAPHRDWPGEPPR